MFQFNDFDLIGVFNAAVAGDGFTSYKGNSEFSGRYVVGGLETVKIDYHSLGYVGEILKALGRMVANPGNAETLGVWLNRNTLYIDLGDTWTTLDAAMQAARQRGELAVWDREECREIDVN